MCGSGITRCLLPSNFHREPPKVEKKRENLFVSYANIGRGGQSEKSLSDKEELAIVLEFGNFVIDNKKLVCLAKARNISTLPNLGMLCHDEDFDNFIIRYVGGLWVMFEFKSKEALIKVIIDDEIFPIRIKEAPIWNPTFVCEFNNIDNDSVDAIHRFEQEQDGSNDSLLDKEEWPPPIVFSGPTPDDHHVPDNYDPARLHLQVEVLLAAAQAVNILIAPDTVNIAT
ncbi:unnamed protein product [Lactuca saligna]|uniref:DUF4283 domain-containing protein n=1 Tax=Lactuca saligna TaxID=75948 RepID=A0AA35USI7_LACSI|nr:unnamed protein product [Lactuca saligna]